MKKTQKVNISQIEVKLNIILYKEKYGYNKKIPL